MRARSSFFALLRGLLVLFACAVGPQFAQAQNYQVTNLGSTSNAWAPPDGINGLGQVAFYDYIGGAYRTFFFDGATSQDIGSFGGSHTSPSAINASGQVVGSASTAGNAASFGLVSKYQKGRTVPTGETQFQFEMANFRFQSVSHEWPLRLGSLDSIPVRREVASGRRVWLPLQSCLVPTPRVFSVSLWATPKRDRLGSRFAACSAR